MTHRTTAKQLLTTEKLQDTYWGCKIIAAEKRGRFTKFNSFQSSCWQTCACGKQDSRIPREFGYMPMDHQLRMLGCRFAYAVSEGSQNFVFAARTLIAIERRAAVVLRKVAGR